MKVGNNSIKGLFIYKNGIIFEPEDLVILNGVIRFVNTEFYGEVEDDLIKHSELWINKQLFSESNPDGPVNTAMIRNTINSMIAGLDSSFIQTITIDGTDGNGLDDYNFTCIYRVYLKDDSLALLLPDRYYILKVYKSDSVVVQEWLDYVNLTIVCRTYSEGSWSSNIITQQGDVNLANQITNSLEKYKKLINNLKNNSYIQYKISSTDGNSIDQVGVDESNKNILTLILINQETSLIKQITFDLTYYNQQKYSDNEISVIATLNSGRVTFTRSNSDWSIISILSSKTLFS